MRTGDMPSSMLETFRYVLRNNGLTGLYSGLSASLLRQITYSTTRFGIYEELKARTTSSNNGKPPSFPVLVAISSISGFIGGISGNAGELCQTSWLSLGITTLTNPLVKQLTNSYSCTSRHLQRQNAT